VKSAVSIFALFPHPPNTLVITLHFILQMPHYATKTLSAEDKRGIVSVLPLSSTHIFAMARGQIYHAPFNSASSNDWKPLDLKGAIIFGRDSRTESDNSSSHSDDSSDTLQDDDLWFRLVELEGKKGPRVVWRQPVSVISSDYKMLVPFFHVFSGNVRIISGELVSTLDLTRPTEPDVRIQIRRRR
jgi:hypothetical protein